jgi:AcrR family transcriptional regulator
VTGLQERRHAETRDSVVAAALALFHATGFGQVTMEDIARAAGVSRRTVYRRFPTKEHIVLEVPKRWLAVWDAVIADLAGGLGGPQGEAPRTGLAGARPRDAAEAACLAVARHIDAHRSDVLVAYAALAVSPALSAAGAAANDAWIGRVVAQLRREPVRLSASTQHVIAGAYLGAIDGMMSQWVRAGGRGSVHRSTRALLERLRPIWPAPATDEWTPAHVIRAS